MTNNKDCCKDYQSAADSNWVDTRTSQSIDAARLALAIINEHTDIAEQKRSYMCLAMFMLGGLFGTFVTVLSQWIFS